MPWEDSGSNEIAASPTAAHPGPPTGSSRVVLRAGGVRRADGLMTVNREQAPDVLARAESRGEPGRGEQCGAIDEIRIGEEGDDSLAGREPCGVPPTIRLGLDGRPAIEVGSGVRPEAGIERDEGVVTAAGGAGLAGDRPLPPGGVDQPGGPQFVAAPLASGEVHTPAGVVSDRPDQPGGGDLRTGIAGRLTQGGVEPGAIEVPARTVRVEEEIRRHRLVAAPDGYVPGASEVSVGEEAIEDAEIAEERPDRRRDRLSDPEVAANVPVGQEDAAAETREHEGCGRARRSATGYHDVDVHVHWRRGCRTGSGACSLCSADSHPASASARRCNSTAGEAAGAGAAAASAPAAPAAAGGAGGWMPGPNEATIIVFGKSWSPGTPSRTSTSPMSPKIRTICSICPAVEPFSGSVHTIRAVNAASRRSRGSSGLTTIR